MKHWFFTFPHICIYRTPSNSYLSRLWIKYELWWQLMKSLRRNYHHWSKFFWDWHYDGLCGLCWDFVWTYLDFVVRLRLWLHHFPQHWNLELKVCFFVIFFLWDWPCLALVSLLGLRLLLECHLYYDKSVLLLF